MAWDEYVQPERRCEACCRMMAPGESLYHVTTYRDYVWDDDEKMAVLFEVKQLRCPPCAGTT